MENMKMNNHEVARTILEQIKYGTTSDNKSGVIAMMCWGTRAFKASSTGLSFKVSGYRLKGSVMVEYDEGHDAYNLKFYNTRKTLKHSIDQVYCDQLTSLIDNTVERAV